VGDAVRLLRSPRKSAALRLTKGVHIGIRTERIDCRASSVMNAPDKRGRLRDSARRSPTLGTTDTFLRQPRGLSGVTLEDVH
jgi:hypothetical protein